MRGVDTYLHDKLRKECFERNRVIDRLRKISNRISLLCIPLQVDSGSMKMESFRIAIVAFLLVIAWTSSAFVLDQPRGRPRTAPVPTSFVLEDIGRLNHHWTVLSSTNTQHEEQPEPEGTANEDENGDVSFFDEATIYVRAGSGGQGSSTYKKAKKGANGIPDGGSGGLGGNVVLRMDPGLNTLARLGFAALKPNAKGGSVASSKKKNTSSTRLLNFRAKDGTAGGRMYDNGRKGEDCEVLVPPGTVVQLEVPKDNDDNEDEQSQSFDLVDIGTVSEDNPTLVVARGGRGGEGTATLKGKKKGATRRGPEGGERFNVKLTLKIVADIALVGVPNAGKSTFLASVTRAKPKIADYPFTTIVPNLGTWILEDNSDKAAASGSSSNSGLVLCDVPGLIEGASEGVGLGHAFLRHIERCRVILHLVDATSDDPIRDYTMVNDELKHYGGGSLAKKPQVVVLNKLDAAFREHSTDDAEQLKTDLASKMKDEMGHTRLLWVSAKEKDGVDDLMIRMSSYVGKMKDEENQKRVQQTEQDATPVA